ncbi:hypothetical protein BDW22DRAFT_1353022 [Trametopsis cervina]|nr:hypothetical protein BDW22DRAFT_1353022 [Trametopsis cervina]
MSLHPATIQVSDVCKSGFADPVRGCVEMGRDVAAKIAQGFSTQDHLLALLSTAGPQIVLGTVFVAAVAVGGYKLHKTRTSVLNPRSVALNGLSPLLERCAKSGQDIERLTKRFLELKNIQVQSIYDILGQSECRSWEDLNSMLNDCLCTHDILLSEIESREDWSASGKKLVWERIKMLGSQVANLESMVKETSTLTARTLKDYKERSRNAVSDIDRQWSASEPPFMV